MAATVLSCYLAVYVFRHGLPASISETYYHIGKRWMFCSALAAVSLLMLVPWVEGGEHEWCAFLSCAAVLFVSASPQFHDSYIGKIHYGAAAVMGICSAAWLLLNGANLYLLILCPVIALADRKRGVWWLEIGLFANVVNALL